MATQQNRPLRADARRNRDAILRAARESFDTDGIFASIDGIAIAAGVGNATFYRNFPTRDDLLAAVMVDTVDDLLSGATALEQDLSADAALSEWLCRLAWQLRIWHDLPTCIASSMTDDTSPVGDISARLCSRTGDFLRRAQADGSASDAVHQQQLFELVTTLSWGIDRFADDAEAARSRVVLATAGVFRRK